ncbi:hypothetical protein DTO271G3_707 [Paecilomyces variotii]|nr:hypothetical protein DTO271G3_707 [Paecilomyces variotii]
MTRLEDLPYELLFMIVDHLDHYGCVVLHSLSKKFSFIRPRIGTRAYFNGSTGDERVLKKLQDIYNSVDGTPEGRPPVEFVFDLTGLPLTGVPLSGLPATVPQWEIRHDVMSVKKLTAREGCIRKIRIIGSWEQARELFAIFGEVEGYGIKNCSLIIANGSEGYNRDSSEMRSCWAICGNTRILHIAGTTGTKKISFDPCANSPFDSRLFDSPSFESHRLRELYIGCDHGKKSVSKMHDCIMKEADFDREVELPIMLRKLAVSCGAIWYSRILELTQRGYLRELTLLNVNIRKRPPYSERETKEKNPSLRPQEALDEDRRGVAKPWGLPRQWSVWQKFADEFERLSLSSNATRSRGRILVVGMPMVNGRRVTVDDSALQTVTALSAAETKKLMLNINAEKYRNWINCGRSRVKKKGMPKVRPRLDISSQRI